MTPAPMRRARSTVTGKATEKCALELRDKIKAFGAEMMGVKAEEVSFDGARVRVETGEQEGRSVTLEEIGRLDPE